MKILQMRNAGITLIALVITIVLLIIIATVSINVAIEDNGIIAKTSEAKFKAEVKQYKDAVEAKKLVQIMRPKNNTIWDLKEQLEKQMEALDVAMDNAYEIITIIQTAEEQANYIHEHLNRIRMLLVQYNKDIRFG